MLLQFGLTATEKHVLRFLATGHTNREIAVRLVCSPDTMKTHVHHILEKLGAKNRREAARIWRASQKKITRNG